MNGLGANAPLAIYVDGSCQNNQNIGADTLAGWGVVILSGDHGTGSAEGEVLAELSGRVITVEGDEDWLGAEVGSNNTGELTGIAQALRWLLSEGGDSPAIIRCDSQYALNIAQANWRAKANKKLAKRVQSLWSEVASLRSLTGKHVHAHRGHHWNERADHLAWRACIGETPLPRMFWKPGQR